MRQSKRSCVASTWNATQWSEFWCGSSGWIFVAHMSDTGSPGWLVVGICRQQMATERDGGQEGATVENRDGGVAIQEAGSACRWESCQRKRQKAGPTRAARQLARPCQARPGRRKRMRACGQNMSAASSPSLLYSHLNIHTYICIYEYGPKIYVYVCTCLNS